MWETHKELLASGSRRNSLICCGYFVTRRLLGASELTWFLFRGAAINSQNKWRNIVLQTRISSLQPTFPQPLRSRGVTQGTCLLTFLHGNWNGFTWQSKLAGLTCSECRNIIFSHRRFYVGITMNAKCLTPTLLMKALFNSLKDK
jgi:hypothetical protein